MIFLFFCSSDFQFPVHGPIPIPLVTSSYSVHQPAMVPHLQQFLTHPIQEPTFQIFQRAPSPLVTCAPNLQPHFTHYGGGMFQETQQLEQLPPVFPIQPNPLPYIDNHHAIFTQPFQPLPGIISCPPAEIESVVSSTAAYQAEVLPAAFPRSLPQSGPLDAVSTTLSAASSHMTPQWQGRYKKLVHDYSVFLYLLVFTVLKQEYFTCVWRKSLC